MNIETFKQIEPYIPFAKRGVSIYLLSKENNRIIEISDFNIFDYMPEVHGKLLIVDEHVDIRHALIKGETIQAKPRTDKIMCPYQKQIIEMLDDWEDTDLSAVDAANDFSKTSLKFRVKPDIDTSWVVDGGYARRANGTMFATKEDWAVDCTEWTPKDGETVYIVLDNRPKLYIYESALSDAFFKANNNATIHPYLGDKFWN